MDDKGTNLNQLELPSHYRRNFWCLVSDFCFFGIAMSFFSTSTVIPGFLTILGASTTVIGLLTTLGRAGWLLPQLFAARYLAGKPYKKAYVLLPAALSRSLIALLAGVIWATGAKPEKLIITLVMFTVTIFFLGDGLASLGWFDLLSKAIPSRRRGRMISTGQVFSGIFSFMAGFVVEWMLSERGFPFPDNFASLFLIGFIMLGISFIAISFLIERKGVTTEKAPTWRQYLPQLWSILKKDRTFRRYTIARQIFGLNTMATPFYMTFALEKLHLPAQVAGRYTSIGVVGSILAEIVFGWLNEKQGTKHVLYYSIIVTAFIPLFALCIPLFVSNITLIAWVYGLVFLVSNASMAIYMPGWTGYILDFASEAERPLYMGLTNTLSGITAIFSTLGGIILQWSGNNYNLLFILTLIGTLCAWPFVAILPEPRHLEGSLAAEAPL
ncbi:MAG: MFS transporter [Anaerolineales bacterium]|nr:MAG: MFS transporter [Anaerolineales bacterium]